MYRITKEQWDLIHGDYKGKWSQELIDNGWQPDLPKHFVGKRTVFEGCISPGAGTALITEGVHFEIV